MNPKAFQVRSFYQLFILLSLCSALFIFLGTAVVAADDTRTVRVGIYENQPKIFIDDKGNPSGFWPDIITYIASKEGWKIQYVHGTWAESLKRLENNELDIMPDVAYSDERSKIYAFSSETVYTSWSKVYSRKGAGIQSILDLKGKNIAVLKGSVNVEGPDGIKTLVRLFDVDCTFTERGSYTEVFDLVQKGEADAGVTSKDFGNQNEANFNLVGTPIIFQPASLYFALPRTSPSTPGLIEKIDYHVKVLKKDSNSIYYQSQEKWLNVILHQNPVIPIWIIWTMAGIGALVIVLGGGSFILRRQVSSRTQALTDEIQRRGKSEEALRTNERRLASMYNTVSDVVFLLAVEPNETYRFESVNPAFGRTTGLSLSAVLGKTLNEIIPGPSLELVKEKYKKAITSRGVVRWEETSDYPTGQLIGEVSVAPVYDDSGNCMYLVGSVHDITERKHAEEEIKKYQEHLEELVRNRTRELEEKTIAIEQANTRLQEVDRLKSVFLATMSHELRTPLNSIIGFTGILQQELVGPVNAEQKKQLGIVRDSSSHLLNLINDVLDISKIEAGQFTVASESCDMRKAIEKVASNLRLPAEKKGLALEVMIAPDIETITSDQRRVEQIIYNLIGNAVKFTEKGRIRIECLTDSSEIVTRVIDTGIGIQGKDMDKLFEPFYQIDTGIIRHYEGTGLGLSICKRILELLGGRIWVESELGKGSVFSFALPAQRK